MRYVVEPQLGSSYARNRAIAEARGEYIFFIDDDAIAEPDWAIELLARNAAAPTRCGLRPGAARMGTAAAAMARAEPLRAPRGSRRSRDHRRRSRGQLDHIHNYFSANVGFRRETFELFGNFREDLGVVGNNPISGEDTELFARIAKSGGAIGFALRARVHHIIGRERMTRQYLRRKAYAFGFGSAIAGGPTHNHLDKLARNGVRMIAAAALGNPERAVYHELECANFFGYWRGRLAIRR